MQPLIFIKETFSRESKTGKKRKYAIFRCFCGNEFETRIENVASGNTKSCGCFKALKELPREIKGIEVVEDLGMNREYKIPKRMAIFRCFCGNEFKATVSNVKNGQRQSCGCLKKRSHFIHGFAKHPLYRKWSGMITRTTNKKEKCYKNYGGRGITVCDEWKNDFMSFFEWSIKNGWEKGLTIDRINNDGNYEPSNCQWLTMAENSKKEYRKNNISEKEIADICFEYIHLRTTVTSLADKYGTHKSVISEILTKNKILIDKKRRLKCYQK